MKPGAHICGLSVFLALFLSCNQGAGDPKPPFTLATDSGAYGACVIYSDGGRVKCWGRNDFGMAGIGTVDAYGDSPGETPAALPFLDLGDGLEVERMGYGEYVACALFTNGRIKCWGENATGGCGLGDTEHRGDDPDEMGDQLPFVDLGEGVEAVDIHVGEFHACAVTTDGRVKCWGKNWYGILGLGDTDPRGDEPDEMGDDLPYVDLGEGETVRQLSIGELSACALLDSGKIKCWGDNEWGQLGIGDKDGRGDNGGEMGAGLPAVGLGSDFQAIQISVGHFHACALSVQGRIKCWGFNEDGQLGLGDYQHRGDDPDEMGSSLPYVDTGSVIPVLKIVAGGYHNCALFSDGQVKCWGRNWNGHLGQGDLNSLGDSIDEMGAGLPYVPLGTDQPVIDVVAGHDHTCVQFRDGSVKCWGDNQYGDLALGDTNNRGDAPGEMGTDLPFLEFGQ